MDKATQTKVSIGAFLAGLIMLFVPNLKNIEMIFPQIPAYFTLMVYCGLLLVAVGYYLK